MINITYTKATRKYGFWGAYTLVRNFGKNGDIYGQVETTAEGFEVQFYSDWTDVKTFKTFKEAKAFIESKIA